MTFLRKLFQTNRALEWTNAKMGASVTSDGRHLLAAYWTGDFSLLKRDGSFPRGGMVTPPSDWRHDIPAGISADCHHI